MKRTLRCIVTLLLAASLLLGVMPFVGAADSLTEAQRAVMETAVAYMRRGHSVQYDSIAITEQGKYLGDGGDIRETDFTSPEDATPDNVMFSVCSAYCFEVYYDTFGYQMLGDPLSCKTTHLCNISADDPMVVVKYDATGKDTSGSSKLIANRDDAIRAVQAQMQPGDWLVAHLGSSGHAMLYAGEYFGDQKCVIHCGGDKYSVETGLDLVENGGGKIHNGGAIRVDTVDTFLFSSNPGYPINKAERIIVLRPLNVLNASQFTENAKGRAKYPGLDIERSASVSRLGAVEQGGEITLSIAIKNWSDTAITALPVTETVPANATLKDSGGATVSGSTLKWTLDVPAGETKKLSYTVTATGKRGDTIDFSGGFVGGIRSNKIPIRIGGKGLSAEQIAKLQNIEKSKSALQGKDYWSQEFLNAAYISLLGIDPKIPSISEIAKNQYDRTKIEGATTQMFVKKDTPPAGYETAAAMLIPYYHGGTLVKTGGYGHLRVLDVANNDYLQPGDVVMGGKSILSGKSAEMYTYLYLGDNKVAYLENDQLKTANASKALNKLLSYEFFVGLRPMQAYDDLNTLVAEAPLPFTDVKEGDWFYEFVQKMYNKKIISGMTATTFVPNGTLTYGQALKLLVAAIDKDPGNASSGHWASNYLAAAKEKGWVDGDVNLDAGISRLAFCQIAAKAKGLSKQPASNPFTDTSDTSVLALVNAGVINGMSETTFAPANTLTRAQIAKIIALLTAL